MQRSALAAHAPPKGKRKKQQRSGLYESHKTSVRVKFSKSFFNRLKLSPREPPSRSFHRGCISGNPSPAIPVEVPPPAQRTPFPEQPPAAAPSTHLLTSSACAPAPPAVSYRGNSTTSSPDRAEHRGALLCLAGASGHPAGWYQPGQARGCLLHTSRCP